ncbi:hypothetical protein FAEPRAM212_02149 [Faecalibacterium prausnitzii M21/2]|uniref:Uncharacterized protein n=1 Tax=Faecalibacterium prausnitzii M21/2 TaxID=411485 RepID=A8SD86_9FIRM|nr:hypothetical protein FAEPRAM212_02149 [Faecalibacterium prausnitzii M21/2]
MTAQPVQHTALALQGKAVLRHQVGAHLIHKMAVQVIDAPALHALEVQVLPAMAPLVHILEHRPLAFIGYIFHNALLAGKLVQITVYSGGVGACALCLQMLQNVGGAYRVLAVVDEVI